MIKYLLDTCVVSDFVKGEAGTLQRLKKTSPSAVAVSSITEMELVYGLSLNPKKTLLLKPLIADFLRSVSILSFDREDAESAAILRANLRKKGMPIGAYDLLLAGTALSRKFVFVTSNSKEFKRVRGLRLENWRAESS